MLVLQLFAHNKLLSSYGEDKETKEYKVKTVHLSLNLKDFYLTAKNVILDVENGLKTIEEGVSELKPLYNSACSIINHNAINGVCKKWVESTKEKNTRAFLIGLLSKYKITSCIRWCK